jgi:hypothetical protein
MNVKTEIIADVLSTTKLSDGRILSPEETQKLLSQIEQQAALEKEADKADREPTAKKQFVILVSDPDGRIPEGVDLVGWVTQISGDDSILDTPQKLFRAAYEHNISKKGRKYPVKTVGEACEAVGARLLNEQGLSIKNKTPVAVIVSDNKIPSTEEGAE